MASALGATSMVARLGTSLLRRHAGQGWPATWRAAEDVSALAGGTWTRFGSMPEEAEEIPDDNTAEKGWGQTKVRDLLAWKRDQGQWLFCCKDDLVFDAVKKMADANVGSLVVFDPSRIVVKDKSNIMSAAGDAVVGIITERDYLRKMVVEGRSSKETLVSEIMTPESKLMTCGLGNSVVETMQIMADKNVRHLPVVDKNRMMGMVSIRDTVKVMVMEHRQEMDQMQQYIQGSY